MRLMDSIDGIRIEADEDGFELVLEGDFEEAFLAYLNEPHGQGVRLRLQGAAWEFARSRGLAELLAWRDEADQAYREFQSESDETGYAPLDPKNPDWHANVSGIHDQRPDR